MAVALNFSFYTSEKTNTPQTNQVIFHVAETVCLSLRILKNLEGDKNLPITCLGSLLVQVSLITVWNLDVSHVITE
jgi:hypothetical protein